MLCMPDVTNYFDGARRPFVEGRKVLEANYLSDIKKLPDENENITTVEGKCIQSSHVFEKPHSLKVYIYKDEKDDTIKITGQCSCIGGANGKCKHICALLMYLERVDDVEAVSCTDVPCKWNKKKVTDLYRPIPIKDYCHVLRRKRMYNIPLDAVSDGLLKECSSIMMEAFQDSAFKKQEKGRGTAEKLQKEYSTDEIVNQPSILDIEDVKKFLLAPSKHVHTNPLLNLVEDENVTNFFLSAVTVSLEDALHIYLNTLNQSKDPLWKDERKVRVTGSRAHELFTYTRNRKPDWNKKVENMFWREFNGTADMLYGIVNEDTALELFKNNLTNDTYEQLIKPIGFLINVAHPWFGVSPDGMLKKRDGSWILLEVKCPKLGKSLSANELITSLKYIEKNTDNTISLKKTHKYYTQIQFGLGLLNINEAILIIYCAKDATTINIPISVDDTFVLNLFTSLTNAYFNNILPVIYNRILES